VPVDPLGPTLSGALQALIQSGQLHPKPPVQPVDFRPNQTRYHHKPHVKPGQVPTHYDPVAHPASAGGRSSKLLHGGGGDHEKARGGDVIDDTVTSWIPDDARRGCHGYGEASEGDDDARQQQHGSDALRMTRLDVVHR